MSVPHRPKSTPLLLAILAEAMGYGAIFGLIADLQDAYGFDRVGLSLVAFIAFPAALFGQLVLAPLADKGHSRKLLWCGLVTAAVGMVLFYFGRGLGIFVFARALVGLGSGTFIPTARRIVIGNNPENPGSAVALAGAADIGGFLLGVPLAKGVKSWAEHAGWEHPVNAPFAVLCIILLLVGPYAALRTPRQPVTDHEKLAVRRVLRIPAARAGLMVGVGFSVAIGTLDAIAARFLKDLGANDKETVIVMLALSIPLVGFMPIAGKFVDRVGPLKAGFMGLIATVPLFVGYGFTRSLLLVGILGAVQAAANSVVYTAGQAAVANSTQRHGLVAAGQGTYEAVAAIGGGLCALGAPLIYFRDDARPMWTALAVLVLIAALTSRKLAVRAEGEDAPPRVERTRVSSE